MATAPSARLSIISARKAEPEPHRAVEMSIMLGGRCTTRPIRVNIHSITADKSLGRGGELVAITVILSRTRAAVLGITRMSRHASCGMFAGYDSPYSALPICSTGTPAQIEISSLPASASFIPSLRRTSDTMYGLQPRMTTSAAASPLTFSFCKTVTLGR